MANAHKGSINWGIDGNGVIDFDSILSDLCDLEHQLSNETSTFNDVIPTFPDIAEHSPVPKKSTDSVVFKDYTKLTSTSPRKVPRHYQAPETCDLPSPGTVDNELDFALSELSALVGSEFEADDNKKRLSIRRQNCVANDLQNTPRSDQFQQNQMRRVSNSNFSIHSNSVENGLHLRKGSASLNGGVPHNWQEHLSDGGQNDSAFDDNISLPSSGSRVSMATSSRSSGSSITNGALGLSNDADEGQRVRDPAKTTADRNDHSNQNKIFVRVYSPEGSSDSIAATERMTVSQMVEAVLAKNHVEPSLSWSLVEQLPNLYMERLLEDSECLADNILSWAKDSENRLVLVDRLDKYDIFLYPEKYLISVEDKSKKCDETVRQVLIQEFLESNCRLPEFEGMLYIKLEGKKAWKKMFFILRASGIYYNPKGKSKSLIDLICLQKLDLVEVYTGIEWKKKYKAPTDFGFALKHPLIQKKAPKYIKYFCAEDVDSMWRWINSIRLAKYGQQLHSNFQRRQNSLHHPNGDDSLSKQKQTALIQEKISEMFSKQVESAPSFGCVSEMPASPLQTFRAESPDGSSSRLLRACLEPSELTSPKFTDVMRQMSSYHTLRSSMRAAPHSPRRVMKESGSIQQLTPSLVSGDGSDDWRSVHRPQPAGHDMLTGSVDQLQNLGSSSFSQSAPKAAPVQNTGKFGISQKHAVIKRTPSIGHRDVDEPPPHFPTIGPASPKPLPLPKPVFTTASATTDMLVSSPSSLPPVRRKFPSSSSFSDCDDGRISLTPLSSPKPKPPLPPKRKDILKPSVSVDSSPTKGRVGAVAGTLTALKKLGSEDRVSESSFQQSPSPKCTSPGAFSVKRSPSCESWQNTNFLMDLERVILQKKATGVDNNSTDVTTPQSMSAVDLDSLPPPPPALLDGMKNQKKLIRPPPPPKRSQETHLSHK